MTELGFTYMEDIFSITVLDSQFQISQILASQYQTYPKASKRAIK